MYWQRGLPAFLATTLAFLILGVAARADVRTVTNSADNGGAGTLRAVIAAAQPGDTIAFDPGLSGQTIVLTAGVLNINKDLTIAGPGATRLAINGGRIDGVFSVPAGVSATIQDLTIQDGHADYGAGILSFGTLTVTGCSFVNNYAVYFGGGIDIVGGTLSVSNCSFTGNAVQIDHYNFRAGGGIRSVVPTTITGCTFTGNTSTFAGGLSIESTTATVTDCTFTGNVSLWSAAGMGSFSSVTEVSNCVFTGNRGGEGGGMHSIGGSADTVKNCVFDGNTAYFYGGGMSNYFSSPKVENCTFTNNSVTSGWGGGMSNYTSAPTVTDCTFSGNWASYEGGAIHNEDQAYVKLIRCRLTGNSAGGGGAIRSFYAARVSMENCILSGNRADYGGGGILTEGDGLSMTNCILSGNSAYDGGAMFNQYVSPTATNCTFFGNSATNRGGGIYTSSECRPTLTNCIVWNSAIYDFPYPNPILAGLTTITYSNVQGGWTGAGNMSVDPGFVNAAAGDFRLNPFSLCINKGSNSSILATGATSDAAGSLRITLGTVDMGAYEYQPNPVDMIQGIRSLVAALVASGVTLPADGQSLYAKLEAAKAALTAGDITTARAKLRDLITQVDVFVKTGKLNTAQGKSLIDAANTILGTL